MTIINSYPITVDGQTFIPDGPVTLPEGDEFTCAACARVLPVYSTPRRLCPEYALLADSDGAQQPVCWDCCAQIDRQSMIDTGRALLYFTGDGRNSPYRVQAFTGRLSFDALRVKRSRHNIARWRYDVWFVGPDSTGDHAAVWHGVSVGEWSMILRCKRTKRSGIPN